MHGTVIFALLMLPALAAATGPGAASNIGTIGEQELLEPERAFLLSARFKDAKTAEFNYKISDGYYMYRARFKVVAEPKNSAILGKAVFNFVNTWLKKSLYKTNSAVLHCSLLLSTP